MDELNTLHTPDLKIYCSGYLIFDKVGLKRSKLGNNQHKVGNSSMKIPTAWCPTGKYQRIRYFLWFLMLAEFIFGINCLADLSQLRVEIFSRQRVGELGLFGPNILSVWIDYFHLLRWVGEIQHHTGAMMFVLPVIYRYLPSCRKYTR